MKNKKQRLSGDKLFGKRLKELREAEDLTQEQFAEMSNVEYQTISRIETGIYFTTYKNLSNFANALNVPIKELFEYDHFKAPDELKDLIKTKIDKMSSEQLIFMYKIMRSLLEFNP